MGDGWTMKWRQWMFVAVVSVVATTVAGPVGIEHPVDRATVALERRT